jgi:predicted TIM-barrel fold metal-dependent hydrolase
MGIILCTTEVRSAKTPRVSIRTVVPGSVVVQLNPILIKFVIIVTMVNNRQLSLVAIVSAITLTGTKVMSIASSLRFIDSHLHVWASEQELAGFPYAEGHDPPASLASAASTPELLKKMDEAEVAGALIVQPISHKFDHSYVIDAMKKHPSRFKGMLLHDPSLSEDEAVTRLEDLALKGFVGVRFNPYLWNKTGAKSWEPMSVGAGLETYKRCAELNMPVGVMCFEGLDLHYDDILKLLKVSPGTRMILDHFAFASLTDHGNSNFKMLLDLSLYPQVYVKVSALFRLGDGAPYERVKEERLDPLLRAFGCNRLMFGTDFPFVLEQNEQYKGTVDLISNWLIQDKDAHAAVMGGTAESVFGTWAITEARINPPTEYQFGR